MISKAAPGTRFVYHGPISWLERECGTVVPDGALEGYAQVRMDRCGTRVVLPERDLYALEEICKGDGNRAVHRWIRLTPGSQVRPDTPYGCQQCPERATGAVLAARSNQVLLTKAAAPYRVYRAEWSSLRAPVAVAGTRPEATALADALECGPVLRRGEVLQAGRAVVWAAPGGAVGQ